MKITRNLAILIVLICGLAAAVGQLLIKLGSERMIDLSSVLNPYIIGGLIIYLVATVLFIFSLKYGEITIMYPLGALIYIWVNALSIIYLGEPNTTLKWAGNALIFFGVMMIGASGRLSRWSKRRGAKR